MWPILLREAHGRGHVSKNANQDVGLDFLRIGPNDLEQFLETFDERLAYFMRHVRIGRSRGRGLQSKEEVVPVLDFLDVHLVDARPSLGRIGGVGSSVHDVHYLTVVPPMALDEQILLAREEGVDVGLRDVSAPCDCRGRRPVISPFGELTPGSNEDRITAVVGAWALAVIGGGPSIHVPQIRYGEA
jgi:hypothetical protein